MRIALLFVLFLSPILPAFAGQDWGQLVSVAAEALASRDASPAIEGVVPSFEASYRLEWAKDGVIDASGRCEYYSGWGRYNCNLNRMKSAIEVAGQRQGILLMAPDSQAREIQARSSQPGYDPRTAPRQGLWRTPQGIVSATITYSGYSCQEQVSLRARSGGRLMEEKYQVNIDLIVFSVETLEPIASATGKGISTATFADGGVFIGGVNVGGLISRRARPDAAMAQAAEQAMAQLANQLLGGQQAPKAGLVVAQVNGAQVVIMTLDGSEIRDAGVVEGMKYSLHGLGVVNPLTGRPSRGTLEIGAIEIISINADIAEGILLPGSQVPVKGAKVSFMPYQSLH